MNSIFRCMASPKCRFCTSHAELLPSGKRRPKREWIYGVSEFYVRKCLKLSINNIIDNQILKVFDLPFTFYIYILISLLMKP